MAFQLCSIKSVKYLVFILISCFIISGMHDKAYAERPSSFEGKKYDIGVSGGMWMSGDISLGDVGVDIEKDSSLMLRIIADSYVVPKFAIGGYFNYSKGTVSYGSIEEDFVMYEFGGALKGRFILSDKVALKPGLNIGYRQLNAPDWDAMDSEGLGINLSVELQFLLTKGYIFYIDGGFLSQPAGGNDITDVTWSPIMYILAGVAF